MAKINARVQEIAGILAAGSTVDKENGLITTTAEARDAAIAAAGLTEILNPYQSGMADFAAAARMAVAQVSKEPMRENAELEMTRSDLDIGNSSLTSKFHRSRDIRNVQDGSTSTAPWCSSSTLTTTVVKKVGQMRAVTEHIANEMYADMRADND